MLNTPALVNCDPSVRPTMELAGDVRNNFPKLVTEADEVSSGLPLLGATAIRTPTGIPEGALSVVVKEFPLIRKLPVPLPMPDPSIRLLVALFSTTCPLMV